MRKLQDPHISDLILIVFISIFKHIWFILNFFSFSEQNVINRFLAILRMFKLCLMDGEHKENEFIIKV